MSDDLNLDDDNETPDGGSGETHDVRRLREHNKELARQLKEFRSKGEAAARVPDLERKLAFYEAGINPDDPAAKWLVKGYDGELTKEAIAAAAAEAGIGQGRKQQQTSDDDDLDREVRRLERSGRATANGRNPDDDAEFDRLVEQARREDWPEHKFDELLVRFGRMGGDGGMLGNTYYGFK